MKKIAILAPEIHEPFIEGIQKNAWSIVSAMASQGMEVCVFTQKTYGKEVRKENIEIFYRLSSASVKFIKYCKWFWDGYRISKIIKDKGIKHLLIFSLDWSFFWTLIWVGITKPKVKMNLVVFSNREISGVSRVLFLIIKQKINHFFTRSEYLSNRLHKIGVSEDRVSKVVVLPNKDQFSRVIKRETTKIKTIAYLSNHEKSAGVDTIINMAMSMRETKFILALRKFSGREEKSASKFLEKLYASGVKNIEVRRNIQDMISFYREVDAVILPVIDENNTMSAPLVLLEAVSSGVLVFMRKLPVFEEYGNAIIFFDDDSDLLEKLRYYSRNQGVSEILEQGQILLGEVVGEGEALKIYLQKYE